VNPDDAKQRRRIVVTLDSGDIDTAELDRLIHLARRLDAELEGVFVEDSDLLRLSELAFVHEFRPISQRSERFESVRMQQELRVVARRAQRTLAAYTEHRGVRWSFRIWRGSMEREMLGALQADVLALPRLGVVFMPSAPRRQRETITACFDGSESSSGVLKTAADLAADSLGATLRVLLFGALEQQAGLRREAEEILSQYHGAVVYSGLKEAGLAALLRALQESGSSVLVMQRDNRLLRNTSLRDYLGQLNCPLILVR